MLCPVCSRGDCETHLTAQRDRLRAELATVLAELDGAVSIGTQLGREAARYRAALEGLIAPARELTTGFYPADLQEASRQRQSLERWLAEEVERARNALENTGRELVTARDCGHRRPCPTCERIAAMNSGRSPTREGE